MIRAIAILLVAAWSGAAGAQMSVFVAPAQDPDGLLRTIAAEKPEFDPPAGVTGLTVPHHLLAADLIARAFWAASAGSYDRIVLIGPDHFRLVPRGFAVARGPQQTVFGATRPAEATAEALLARADLFSIHPDPAQEHGIAALLPFATHFFPDTEVLPIVASISTRPADWAAATDALIPLVTERTLVIQSTDFSHFRPVGEAALHDQQTLSAIMSGEADRIAALHQPAHLDSKAAQFVQMALQRRRGATPAVIANRNSVDYGTSTDTTTSYVVAVYHTDPTALSTLKYTDHARLMFGGDVLTGRYLLPVLQDAHALAAVLETVRAHTGGAPLVINLEGVIVPEHIPNAPAGAHLMPKDLTLPVLRDMGVIAAGLANNHTMDFGADGLAETASALEAAGITPAPHAQAVDLGPVRVLALNMLPGTEPFLAGSEELGPLCASQLRAPVIAVLHWGKEYTSEPATAERELADRLAACGVSAVIGGHSHRADPVLRVAAGQMPWTFSLGNLLFDQTAPRASGQLAEVRVFPQGTVAIRLVPLPNLFELARGEAGLNDVGAPVRQ